MTEQTLLEGYISVRAALKAGSRPIDRITIRGNKWDRGVAWLDAGTHESLLQAAGFVQAVQDRQGMMISCPEEIAYRMGTIDREQLMRQGQLMKSNDYGQYLIRLAQAGLG